MNPNAKEFRPASWLDEEVAWEEAHKEKARKEAQEEKAWIEAHEEKARRESELHIDKFLAESVLKDIEGDDEAAHIAEDRAFHLFVQHVHKRTNPPRDHAIAAKIVAHLQNEHRGYRWCA